MAIQTFSVAFDNTTDTTYRAWGSAISAALAALGWVQTTDTGQVNWTTATRSATSGTNYEVWRTNDGSAPLYMKLEYVNTNSVSFPGIAVTLGFATNGAGTLTGTQVTPRVSYAANITADTGVRSWVMVGNTSRFVLACTSTTATNNVPLLSVERGKTTLGADDATSALLVFATATTANTLISSGLGLGSPSYSQVLPTSGGVPPIELTLLTIASMRPTTAGSSAYGGNVGVGTVSHQAGGPVNPGLNVMSCNVNDLAALSSQTVTRYGTAHTYLRLPDTYAACFNQRNGASGDNNLRALILYE